MNTDPSANPVPQAVLDAIQNYLVRADRFFSRRDITYSASCKVTAATSVDDQIWTAGARPDAP